MSPQKDTSPPLPRWVGVAVGVFLLLVSCGMVALAGFGIAKGETLKFSRRNGGMVSRSDHPADFWFCVGAWTCFGAFLGAVSVKTIKKEIRPIPHPPRQD